jgi:hypothetical protein
MRLTKLLFWAGRGARGWVGTKLPRPRLRHRRRKRKRKRKRKRTMQRLA